MSMGLKKARAHYVYTSPFVVVLLLALGSRKLAAQTSETYAAHVVDAAAEESIQQQTDAVRDPHAWSDGYTLDNGPYVLPGPRQLRLSDEHDFLGLMIDRLERVDADNDHTTYDVQAWFGRDYQRLVIKTEGDYVAGKLEESKTDLLYSRAVASYWDAQLGLRYDTTPGPDRHWLAIGMQGLAPYWFEFDATAYIATNGRTALTVRSQYDLLLTQRLILQPRAEIKLYGKSDKASVLGSGLSDAVVGLRLRYEFSRQFAPYIGVEWTSKFGQTSDLVRANGNSSRETRYVAGIRAWF